MSQMGRVYLTGQIRISMEFKQKFELFFSLMSVSPTRLVVKVKVKRSEDESDKHETTLMVCFSFLKVPVRWS